MGEGSVFRWVRRFLHQASLAYPAGNNIYIHIIHILSIFFAKISKDTFFFFAFLNDVIIPKKKKKCPLLIASALGCKFLCLWSSK